MYELTISLDTKRNIPLYEQIYDYIKQEIQQGKIQSGERLPSTRALSRHLEVSRSTIELAYEQLLSEGYVETQPYRGFFISQIDGLYRLEYQEWLCGSGTEDNGQDFHRRDEKSGRTIWNVR